MRTGLVSTWLILFALAANAQPALQTAGTTVVVAGASSVARANDQTVVVFFADEQDKDKAAAASRVNQKMKAGLEP